MDETKVKYCGFIKKFLFKKNDNWGLALFANENNNGTVIKIAGNIGAMKLQMNYEICGVLERHPRFGSTFRVEVFNQVPLKNKQKLVQFLSSSLFPGIGAKTATVVVDYYGEDMLFLVKSDPQSLFQIPNLGAEKAAIILEKLQANEDTNLRKIFFEQDLSLHIYEEITKLTENEQEILELLTNNFHGWARDQKIGSFLSVDKIAVHFGLALNSSERIAYWAEYLCLRLHFNTGNTFTDKVSLMQALTKHLEITDQEVLLNGLYEAKVRKLLYFEQQRIYAQEAWEDEETIIKGLDELMCKPLAPISEEVFQKTLTKVEWELQELLKIKDFHYDCHQRQTLRKFLDHPIILVTGGPGTGKSTLIFGMVKIYEALFPKNSLRPATPTGRAAARLKELLPDNKPVTIHRLLEANDKGGFAVNEHNPLKEDLVILDEMSMVDNHLFAQFIRGKGRLSKLVLVGDVEQLPPVNYGNIFEDLISSQLFTLVKLAQIYRQDFNNGIITLAHNIQQGLIDEIVWNQLNGVEILFDQDLETNLQTLELDYGAHLAEIKQSPFYYQIIAPMYNGDLGIDQLNNFIQTKFNNLVQEATPVKYQFGKHSYFLNDKIMCLKNNLVFDLTNGEVGVIRHLEFANQLFSHADVQFTGEKVVALDRQMFQDVTLGYACSVHKTQGSEYNKVVLILDNQYSFFLNKKMIYTAITRAKNALLIIGKKDLLVSCLKKPAPVRHSTIKEKLVNK